MPTIRPALLPLVLPVLACGPTTWQADLPVDAADPIAVRSVTARLSTAAGLGSDGITMTSTSAKNSVSFELGVVVQHALPAGGLLGTRSTCTVDGGVWATRFTGDAMLDGTSIGTAQTSHAAQYMPQPFASGVPSACQIDLRVQPGRVGPGFPEFTPVDLGAFCWTAEAGVTDGPCPASALPRTVPSDRLAIGPMLAQWHAKNASGAGGLAFSARVTVGVDAGPGDLTAAAACVADGTTKTSRSALFASLRDYVPGDSFAITAAAFDGDDFATPPERCTIEIRHRITQDGVFEPAASFCLQGGAVSDGACDALAPDAAVRTASLVPSP